MIMGRAVQEDDEDETLLRRLVLPEEERLRRYPTSGRAGGYRWFRSPNIIRLEEYRHQKLAGDSR